MFSIYTPYIDSYIPQYSLILLAAQCLLPMNDVSCTDCVYVLQYEGSIEENTKNVEVLRVKAKDLDIDAHNQDFEYVIVTGNEGGYFTMVKDPQTNEGVLMLNKVSAVLHQCSYHLLYSACVLQHLYGRRDTLIN